MNARRFGRPLVAAFLLQFLTLAGANAQSVGYQLNRYEPAPAGDGFVVVEAPWYAATRWFAARLLFDHSFGVLGDSRVDENGQPIAGTAPVDNQSYGRFDLAIAPLARVAFTLSLPVLLREGGTAFGDVSPGQDALIADPRLGARVRLFALPEDRLVVSGSLYVWIPVGARDQHAGDGGVRVMPRLVLAGLAGGHWRWGANTSFLYRETARLSNQFDPSGNTVGSELQVAAGASYVALDGRLSIGPEATAFITVADVPDEQSRLTAELFGAARYTLSNGLELGLGFGVGVAGSPAPPEARLMFSLTYAPSARRRLSRFESVVVLPDEDGHVGGVEVNDGKTTTVLDKAYASSEISQKDTKVRPVQSSPAQVEKQTGGLTKTLPASDLDSDGLADAVDACPDRAGPTSADAIRHGCPEATEKVVVLPDEDGHVGGVEVDDGKTTTVLDKPYASSEVGKDGSAREVPASSSKAVNRSVAGVATVLPASDVDDDGIADGADACPDRAGQSAADPVRHGCPAAAEKIVVLPDADGHVGGIEIDDGKTKTVLDKPYASAEVGTDGAAKEVAPSSPKAVEKSTAAMAKSMPIADDDGDGIRDELDACPERSGVASTDPVRRGCSAAVEKVVVLPDADGHVGGVEVDDGKTKTVLDKPYASSEVGKDGRARAVPDASPWAAKRSVAAIAIALPLSDRDDDGVADGDDACADRVGVARAGDPTRNGCPRAVEKVVVLPDEDGHIGAIEVDDGQTVTIVDQAYGTAEIGGDGKALKVAAVPEEVAQEFAPALAAQPSGARMIIYFNDRAQPVRDISGPMASLVAETSNKTEYTIMIVGHTDQTGRSKKNLAIGLERAQFIGDGLIAAGIPRERVKVSSKGSSEPAVKVKSRRTVELRNRRVEVFVVYPTSGPASGK